MPEEMIAEREIYSITPEGEEKIIYVALGRPYEVGKDSWACPVVVRGIYVVRRDIVGSDSWQALNLAIRLIEQCLNYYVFNGGKLYWSKGGDAIEVSDIIPRIGATQSISSEL